MTRLLISVEGKSEKMFVEQTLVLYLSNFGVFVQIHDMKGKISVDRVREKLNRLIHHYDFVTTLYDFYGFKGLGANETKKTLEKKIKKALNPNNKIKLFPIFKCMNLRRYFLVMPKLWQTILMFHKVGLIIF